MQAKTALGQRRQAEHPHVWGGGRPSQPSLACSAAHLGQIVEEGPQPEEHRQHEHAGEEARQLQGEGHGAKAGRNLTRRSRETASCLCVSLLESLPPPQTPFHAAVPLSATPAFPPRPINTCHSLASPKIWFNIPIFVAYLHFTIFFFF